MLNEDNGASGIRIFDFWRVAWSAAKPMAMNGSTIEKYRIMAIPFQGLTMPLVPSFAESR